ncbi:MAG: prenyltransferase/squalene oxidase repeat-containing protein [Promethearchaeota archaeon]
MMKKIIEFFKIKKLDRRLKQKLKLIIIILAFFSVPLITLALVNTRFIIYISEGEVQDYKKKMEYFSNTHQNPTTGLFVEPDIDSNYLAIHSLNYSSSDVSSSSLIDPSSNPHLEAGMYNFFFNYLIDKQNENGSFSDIGGLGNMFSTFEVVETINRLDSSFLNSRQDKITKIGKYLSISLEDEGWGFTLNNHVDESDIISTYCAIKIAKTISKGAILNNENISKFINHTGGYPPFYNFSGSYRYSLNPFSIRNTETTYYGIKAFLEMNMAYNETEKELMELYFNSTYNLIEGGYSNTPGAPPDIQSTYHAISSLYNLGLTPINEKKTLKFVLKCNNSDGGFGLRPDIQEINFSSEFKSGWAAMNVISLLEKNGIKIGEEINESRRNYYDWLYLHQAKNGLFGKISIESNYLGALSVYHANSTGFSELIKMNNTLDFVEDCYNSKDGGFGSQPDLNSSLFSTYCAIHLYDMFYSHTDERWLLNSNATRGFLVDLQNPDGGFKIGNDTSYLLSLFGSYYNIYSELINTSISTTEGTYWALTSLDIIEGRDYINNEALIHWIKSCQNADGGFPAFIGFYSDVISTYFGLEIFKELSSNPMSIIAAIEFLKLAQSDNGSFMLIPVLSILIDLPESFIVSYLGSKALYDFNYQPENIEALINWYDNCFNINTGGMGDHPGFGGDLRNNPYGLIIIEELRYDQILDSKAWSEMLIIVLFIEICIFAFIGLIKLSDILALSKKLKELFRISEKFNIAYLQKSPAIYCEDLIIFAGRKLIVDSMSLQLEHGQILGVLGESGAGKSTFVKSLLGMRKYKGINRIYGLDVKKNSKKMRPLYGYVPQDISKVYENFTVLENLLYFGNQYGLTEKEITSKAKRILRGLEIEDKTNEFVRNLSGGQKRRVSIAIGLIHSPPIVWMDEPTSGLDPVIRENLWLTLTKINEQFNTTMIVITHYPEESRFCNKIALFGRNRGMIDFGRPRDLLVHLPGNGRTVEIYFSEIKENAVERIESIEGIEKVLENKVGTDYLIFSDLNLNVIHEKIEKKMGFNSIQRIKQSDTKMEEYFRFKAMELPEV